MGSNLSACLPDTVVSRPHPDIEPIPGGEPIDTDQTSDWSDFDDDETAMKGSSLNIKADTQDKTSTSVNTNTTNTSISPPKVKKKDSAPILPTKDVPSPGLKKDATEEINYFEDMEPEYRSPTVIKKDVRPLSRLDMDETLDDTEIGGDWDAVGDWEESSSDQTQIIEPKPKTKLAVAKTEASSADFDDF